MRLSTSSVYIHSIIANKGFKFDPAKTPEIYKIINHFDFKFNKSGTVLEIKENNCNTIQSDVFEILSAEFETLLIEIDNTDHHEWLDANLGDFWKSVFNKTLNETGCGRIISSASDICYGYKDTWLKAKIPFYYGVAIYLLTYTPEYSDESRSDVCQWVIDNYPKYVKLLPTINERVENEIKSM